MTLRASLSWTPAAAAPLAVLFDVDGTLVDSVELHAEAWREALARFGKHVLRAAGSVAVYRDPADLLARYEASPLATGA